MAAERHREKGPDMAIDDLAKKAGDFISENSDKIQEALKSEQAEGVSDTVLSGAADLANKLTGGKFEEQIEGVRDNIDKQVGNE